MKRVLAFLAVATAILAVSCNKEQQGPMSAEKNTVTFTVNADQLATRAVTGTHGTANRLQVGVYLNDTFIQAISKTGDNAIAVTTWPATVSLDLARNETYKIVFWADNSTADPYLVDWSAKTVADKTAEDPYTGNLANRDAFYKVLEVTPTGSASQSVTLVRPLAQVNVGTNDLAAFKAAAQYEGNIETKVDISGVASGMNLLTGAATGNPKDMTFNYAASLTDALVSGGSNYDYLALNYILCPADATVTAEISIRKASAEDNINAFTVSNMPVKPNYRTNVVGKLLTGTVVYTVDVDTDFINDIDKKVAPTFASVDDLNTYFATMANNADNGDINPEEVTLTAIADGETITLPAIAGDVVIRIPATLATGTLNIAYAASGSKPANLSLYVEKLKKLVANIPATHFTLLAGSYITDTAEVQTSSTTFVIQKGARVGTAVIKQGNASIAGEVKTVSVPQGATADGEAPTAENAVYVFLTKESAVDEIVLAAKSDVVVEQPKDHIAVGDTDYKVAVYVNEGAANSTAKAQNGGVIYVEAEVPCSVTADGTSEAEDGTATSSTVIIKEGAAGSAVVATNGGAVNLSANDDCTVYSDGKSDAENPVSSTITITSADSEAEVNASTNNGGKVTNTSGQDVLVSHAAKIDDVSYGTLEEAFAAVPDGIETVITLQNHYVIQGNAGITIGASKNIVLDLNGWLLSNAVDQNTHSQVFNINGGTLTLRDSKGNGEIFNAVKPGTQPGEWWSTPQYNYATNVIKNSGTFILESGTVRQTASGSICYAVDNNSTSYDTETILKGGVMTSNRTTMRMFCNSAAKENKLTIPENSKALLEGNKTSLWIQLPGSDPASMKRATLNIQGGTLKGNTYAFYDYTYGDGWDNVNYAITGGNFIGEIDSAKPNAKFIKGGTFSQDPQNYVADGYVSYFDDAAQVWKIKLEDVAQVGDVMYTSLVDAFEAAQAGDEVKMVKNMYIEATVPTPYGKPKCGIKQDGEILNGQNYNLYLTTGGDQYTIMTSGGTIKNLTIASGFRAILLMYPQTDVYIDNVTSGPNVCYAINTAEQGNPDARIIATNSTFLGWCSFSLIASASFTNCKFGQGTYYTDTWGRYIRPYVTTTFTDCEFGYNCAEGDKYYLDLCALQAGQTIKMINCKVGDTVITAENVADLLDGSDESNNNYSFDKSIFEIIQFE